MSFRHCAARTHAIAVFCLLLSACAAPRHRPEASPATPAPQERPLSEAAPVQPEPSTTEQDRAADRSPWTRLQSRFVLDSCNYSSGVLKEARTYTRGARTFVDSLRDAMPFLLLVLDDIERRNLPGEFALLPYVESRYRPVPARGRGPAGMWQLMGRTAIDQGLQVSKPFDQRLDAIASTRVALDLIERYDREFADWRVATMAFNAGEYRVKRQLGKRSAKDMDADELSQLKLSRITHQHLNRLLALACIIEQPEAFDIELPAPEPGDALEHLEFASPIDLQLAANLLDIPTDELHRFNAAWRGEPGNIPPLSSLLVPRIRATTFEENLSLIPADRRAAWHQQDMKPADTWASLASAGNLDIQALAIANGMTPESEPAIGTLLLLPGPGPGETPASSAATHVVTSGDTLTAIARRYGVKIAQLLRWNNLQRNSILSLGTQLRIRAPQY